MKKCKFCGRGVNSKWNYCPICGAEIEKPLDMMNLIKRQMDILRNLTKGDDFHPQKNKIIKTGVTIKINSSSFGEPEVKILPIRNPPEQKYNKKPIRKISGEIIEPETKIKRFPNEIIIDIQLPDIKSENDIEINRLSDSVELRAYAKDKGYFKILSIPRTHTLVEKKLVDGTLTLKFSI